MRLFTFSTTETAAPFCNYDGRHVCGLCAGRKMAIWKMCPQSLLYLVKRKKGVKTIGEERDVELKCTYKESYDAPERGSNKLCRYCPFRLLAMNFTMLNTE